MERIQLIRTNGTERPDPTPPTLHMQLKHNYKLIAQVRRNSRVQRHYFFLLCARCCLTSSSACYYYCCTTSPSVPLHFMHMHATKGIVDHLSFLRLPLLPKINVRYEGIYAALADVQSKSKTSIL